MPIRIVVGGVPNCGKSTLSASVYKELQARGINIGIHELDVFENTLFCILGIESWEKRIKVKSGDWSNLRVSRAMDAFLRDKSHFVLGDLTGIIDGLLKKMVKNANKAIAIGRDWQSLNLWLNFFNSQGIPVVLKIISYVGKISNESLPKDILFVGNLERKVLRNNEISEVADRLIESCIDAD